MKTKQYERDLINWFMDYNPMNAWINTDGDVTWEDLMPVVEKIVTIRCAPESKVDHDTFFLRTFGMLAPATKRVMVRFNRMPLFEADTLIDATYLAVVDFTKQYQEQKES